VSGPKRPKRPPSASNEYATLVRAVEAAARRHNRIPDPLERARALSELLAALGKQMALVTGDRDAALIELFRAGNYLSHRALSRDVGLSRQRVDQLAAHARAGGRPRRA
jgi:hypothetical protein